MLIATFGPTTEWVGKTIIREGDVFLLEDHGPVSARDVMEYDKQGHLVWADVGTRAWVGSLALAAPAAPATIQQFGVLPLYLRQHSEQAQDAGQSVNSSSRVTPYKSPDGRTQGQVSASIIGLLLLIVGLGVAGYFLAFFDVSVPVDYQASDYGFPDRVNNIGLMADRNNGIVIGFALAIGGGVLMVIGRKRTRPQLAPSTAEPTAVSAAPVKGACNACGGLMDVGVAYCPHCGQKLSWTGVEGPPAAT
jgi:hypothetical protein